MKYIVIFIVSILGCTYLAVIGCEIAQAFASRNAQIRAYRTYYRCAEQVLYHSNSDSVPPSVYDRYLDALSALDKYREGEP